MPDSSTSHSVPQRQSSPLQEGPSNSAKPESANEQVAAIAKGMAETTIGQDCLLETAEDDIGPKLDKGKGVAKDEWSDMDYEAEDGSKTEKQQVRKVHLRMYINDREGDTEDNLSADLVARKQIVKVYLPTYGGYIEGYSHDKTDDHDLIDIRDLPERELFQNIYQQWHVDGQFPIRMEDEKLATERRSDEIQGFLRENIEDIFENYEDQFFSKHYDAKVTDELTLRQFFNYKIRILEQLYLSTCDEFEKMADDSLFSRKLLEIHAGSRFKQAAAQFAENLAASSDEVALLAAKEELLTAEMLVDIAQCDLKRVSKKRARIEIYYHSKVVEILKSLAFDEEMRETSGTGTEQLAS